MSRRQLLQLGALAAAALVTARAGTRLPSPVPELGQIIGRYGDGQGGTFAWLEVVALNPRAGWGEAMWRDAKTEALIWEPFRFQITTSARPPAAR